MVSLQKAVALSDFKRPSLSDWKKQNKNGTDGGDNEDDNNEIIWGQWQYLSNNGSKK